MLHCVGKLWLTDGWQQPQGNLVSLFESLNGTPCSQRYTSVSTMIFFVVDQLESSLGLLIYSCVFLNHYIIAACFQQRTITAPQVKIVVRRNVWTYFSRCLNIANTVLTLV